MCHEHEGVPLPTTPATTLLAVTGVDQRMGDSGPGLEPGVAVGLVLAVVIVLLLGAVAVAVVLKLRLSKSSKRHVSLPSPSSPPATAISDGETATSMPAKDVQTEDVQGDQHV